ncbi:hypothetical protein MKW98_018533, partial [Papaver atlanticum]
RCLQLAQTLTPCVKKGEALTNAQVKVLQAQIKDLPDPNKDESFEDLKRGLKRSRHSSMDVGTSQHQPLSSSSESTEEDMNARGRGRGRGRGHGGRDGPRTRGGNKRGRGCTRKEYTFSLNSINMIIVKDYLVSFGCLWFVINYNLCNVGRINGILCGFL